MAKLSIEELIAAFKELSLVEVSEFGQGIRGRVRVTAAAPLQSCRRRRSRRVLLREVRVRRCPRVRWRQEDRSDQGKFMPWLPPLGLGRKKGPG